MGVAVCLNSVSKKFGSIAANSNISLSIEEGTIHALVGENGAGKSTLSKIIYGMHLPSAGEIFIQGKPVRFTSPAEAIASGIGMVHQHFMLVPELSVAENIILGHENARLFNRLPLKQAKAQILKDAETYGLAVNPDDRIADLSTGEQQRVEILKLLFRRASIMIFDEPTAVLTPPETARLFATLHSLRNKGNTIILITHKLDEVLAVADTVSVMKQGKIVGTVAASSTSKAELACMMVGRNVLLRVTNPLPSPEQTILTVNKLGYRTPQGDKRLDELTLTIRAGEIYGIAGVEGNGQSELLQILWGLAPKGSMIFGDATLQGTSLIAKSPADIARMGVSHTPENRLRNAVILDYTVSQNLLFGRHREPCFHWGIGFNKGSIQRYAEKMISEYDIRCAAPSRQRLGALSGGNQQKVVLARELDRPGIVLLVLAQPTRGVDIGAIETIHKKIIDARKSGMAILLVSSELEEIIALSTRIGCLYKGSIRHEFSQDEVALKRDAANEFEKEIGLYIT